MNRNDLFESIGAVDDALLERSERNKKKKKNRGLISAVAAVLTVAVVGTSIWQFGKHGETPLTITAHAIATPEYPEVVQYPTDENDDKFGAEWDKWMESSRERGDQMEIPDELNKFWKDAIQNCLKASPDENGLCSPVNLYMALTMLAEVTDGDSRQQILNAIGADSLEESRKQAEQVWNLVYRNDGATTTILANSLWLNDSVTYKEAVLKVLAEKYYASSFTGDMGSEEYDELLRKWMNEETGNLLEDQIKDMSLPENGILDLISTIYYKARWDNEFDPKNTKENVFHGKSGDETADFMFCSAAEDYYWGTSFQAVRKEMKNNEGTMWLILPEEGMMPEELLESDELYEMLENPDEWENKSFPIVNLSLPKFDINTKFELEDVMKEMGICDVFDEGKANFKALTDEDTVLSKADQGIRVAIDEEGMTAAAYTEMMMCGTGMIVDEVDFTLDRPFLFVQTNDAGIPLFAGIVNTVK